MLRIRYNRSVFWKEIEEKKKIPFRLIQFIVRSSLYPVSILLSDFRWSGRRKGLLFFFKLFICIWTIDCLISDNIGIPSCEFSFSILPIFFCMGMYVFCSVSIIKKDLVNFRAVLPIVSSCVFYNRFMILLYEDMTWGIILRKNRQKRIEFENFTNTSDSIIMEILFSWKIYFTNSKIDSSVNGKLKKLYKLNK